MSDYVYLCDDQRSSPRQSFGEHRVGDYLGLGDNQLSSLPESFGKLAAGGHLDLQFKKLSRLRESLFGFGTCARGLETAILLFLMLVCAPVKNILVHYLVQGAVPYPFFLVATNQLAQCLLVGALLLPMGMVKTPMPPMWQLFTIYAPISILRLSFSVLRAVSLKHLTLPLFAALNIAKFPVTYIVGIMLGKETSRIFLWFVCVAVSLATFLGVLQDRGESSDGAPNLPAGIAASLGATASDIAVIYLIQRVAEDVPPLDLMALTSPVYFVMVTTACFVLEFPDMRQKDDLDFTGLSIPYIAVTCVCSIAICLVEFHVIGKFGALLFSMVYRLQGCLVFGAGVVILHQACNLIQVFSYIIAAALLFAASYWKMSIKKKTAEAKNWEAYVTADFEQRLKLACQQYSDWEIAPTFDEATAAMHEALERLAARLNGALRDEKLLPSANISVQSSDGRFSLLVEGWMDGQLVSLSVSKLIELARFLCSLCPDTEQNAPKIANELSNSLENECLSILYQSQVWAPEFASEASLWASQMQRKHDSVDMGIMFWEQYAAFTGHPRHPMYKRKSGLTLAEVAIYSPEFAPEVDLEMLAIFSDLLVVNPSPEAWYALCNESCPEAMNALRNQVQNWRQYTIMPVHPLNLSKMRELYAAEFQAGCMVQLDLVTEAQRNCHCLTALPALSVRTMLPLKGAFEGYRIKLPIPVETTSLSRYISPVEVHGSHIMTDILSKLTLSEDLVIQHEPFGAHLRFGKDEKYSYEEARYCSFLLRQSPGSVAQPNCLYVPLASLFCKHKKDGITLWEDLWQVHTVEHPQEWFTSYVLVVLRAQLSAFLRYGMTMEAHQQNTCLEFTANGYLNRMIYQELGGGIYWDGKRLDTLPSIDFRKKVYERDDILQPWQTCVNVLRHTMLQMHLLPLVEIATAHFKLPKQQLDGILSSCINEFLTNSCAAQDTTVDQMCPEEYSNRGKACIEGLTTKGERKCLLKMRLMQTKHEQYVPASPRLNEMQPNNNNEY